MLLFPWSSSLARAVIWAMLCLNVPTAFCVQGETSSTERKQEATTKEVTESEEATVSSDIVKPKGELTADLLRHELIPDFIYDVPSNVCTVEWVEGDFADLGNLIPAEVVNHNPYWLDWKGNASSYYTFIMSGLDEPSRNEPSLREYQHWILVNIPGNKFKEGETLVYYKVPAPQPGTGMHRHGIVVYKQPGRMKFEEKPIKSWFDDKRRGNFSNTHFAEKYSFGEPVAVNFFQTEWVPPPTTSLPATLYTSPIGWTSWRKVNRRKQTTSKRP